MGLLSKLKKLSAFTAGLLIMFVIMIMFIVYILAYTNKLLPQHIEDAQYITKKEITEYLQKKYGAGCEIEIIGMAYMDITPNISNDLLLKARTCFAKDYADILAAYTVDVISSKNSDGVIKEITFYDNYTIHGPEYHLDSNIIGRITDWGFYHDKESNRLCKQYSDQSGRPNPISQCFTFDGNRYNLTHFRLAKVYETSFTCDLISTPRERTVCGNEHLAKADIELNKTYKELLDGLDKKGKQTSKEKIIKDQKEWLARIDSMPVVDNFDKVIFDEYRKRDKFINDLLTALNEKY